MIDDPQLRAKAEEEARALSGWLLEQHSAQPRATILIVSYCRQLLSYGLKLDPGCRCACVARLKTES